MSNAERPAPHPPSLWAEVTAPRDPAPALTGEFDVEVVVIGGGFTGLSTALHLAKRGRSVALLEANAIGWGASGRNNGQVIPTLTAVEPDAIVARFGENGERFVHLIGNSAEFLFRLLDSEGIEAEAEQQGWFQPAHSPGRIRLSEKRVEAWRRFGFQPELLDRDDCARLLGSRFWHGGMLNRTGGHLNPLALARGLATACERRGVRIFEASPATDCSRAGEGWRVTTEHGVVKAKAAALATNAYTDDIAQSLAPRLARTFAPVLTWQMATGPIDDRLRQVILPGRQAVSDTSSDLRIFRYDARNRLITGGAVIGPWKTTGRVRAKAARRLAEAFPELGAPEMTHVWSGRIGITPDRFPRVHRMGRDFWAWCGCNGRGVALSVSLGRDLAAAIDGAPLEELALPVTEPRAIPLRFLARRVAPYYLAWRKRGDRREFHEIHEA